MCAEVLYTVAHEDVGRIRDLVVPLLKDERFVRWVRFHQMGSLLYDLLPEARETFLLDRATSISRWKIWDTLREILIRSPVPVLAFKGVAVGEIYPNRLQRLISDVDLWVDREDLDEISRYLTFSGLKWEMDVPNQRIFRYEGLPVEVHTAFTRFPYPRGIGKKEVMEHRRRLEGNLFFPDESLSLSILYLHAYKSMYVKTTFKAVWWYDERLLLRRGARAVGGKVIEVCKRWFHSVQPRELRGEYLEDNLTNRLRYLWHGIKLWKALIFADKGGRL